MSIQPIYPVDRSTGNETGSSSSNESSSYVRSLLEKKRLELLGQLDNIRASNQNAPEKSSSAKDFLELKIEQINKLITFMDTKNEEKNITNNT